MPIDYSKWDNLSVHEESDTEQDYVNIHADRVHKYSFPRSFSGIPKRAERDLIKRGISYTKEENSDVGWLLVGPLRNIRVHPDDNAVLTYSNIIFTEDPNTYIPNRSEYEDDRVKKWGFEPPSSQEDEEYTIQDLLLIENFITTWKNIYMINEDESNKTFFNKKSIIQLNSDLQFYIGNNLNEGNPEYQFIDVLTRRKSRYIDSEEITAAMKFTYIIKIELRFCEKDVWRRVRVPSGIALSVLHDQVICPVMGWSRGYHGYAFEDPVDGAGMGPPKGGTSEHIMNHIVQYKKLMDDKGCPLAALLRKKGDVAYYTYDLENNWEHRLVLEDIVAEEDGVTLMEGAGACPPEDSKGLDAKGCKSYANFLKEYKRNPKKHKMKKAIKQASRSSNYARSWMGGIPIPFKPLEFNIEYHRMMMRLMISGPSVNTKPDWKKYEEETQKGNRVVPPAIHKESYKGCDNCGNRLKTLNKCAGCRRASYCSRECQVQAWKVHKVECKEHSVNKAKK